ncbi:MAG TPA: M20/M25/M40 family metallo-hydrolase [Vicinamibacterales bacterium]|nr:M20/M25/M40 family metallo-hydrolase [Vicinamibacterales bacterium]
MGRGFIAGLAIACGLTAACTRPARNAFSTDRAREHVRMLAGTIGSRPAGSEANEGARVYVVEQLRALGFEVRVQSADGRRPELGLTARVHNVIATKEGSRRDALAIVSHYDSSPHGPGAADAALGVAVALEAARVLLQQPTRHTLAVLVTDGEELGLLGAAALTADPVARRLAAYVNLEAVGSAGPVQLFETGPGNSWIVDAWARAAPEPRGGSLGTEIYRRLPNDTDFSIFKRLGVPGLNFAPILDGYAYHTPRDTPERLSTRTIDHAGQTVVGVVRELDAADLSRRTLDQATYFDLAGWTAFAFRPAIAAWIVALALALGLLAWFKSLRAVIPTVGGARFLLTVLWSLLGAMLVLISMIAAAWLLRESREVYHPWYARPNRLFALIGSMGLLAGWFAARIGALFPHRVRGTRHPVLAWAVTLPLWVVLATALAYAAPTAAYLFTVPLLVSAVLLLVAPLSRTLVVRLVSLVAFAFTLALWGPPLYQVLHLAIGRFGHLPVVTPFWVYAALMFVGALVMAPPLLAALTGGPIRRPAWTTALVFVVVVVCVGLAYSAPAYTEREPLRRVVQYAQDSTGSGGYWQVGSVEPGLDLHAPAAEWMPLNGSLPLSLPTRRLPHPFVFYRRATEAPEIPGRATLRTTAHDDVVEFTISVVPSVRGLTASFVMPPGMTPVRANIPGILRAGQWTASFAAVPLEGAAFHAYVPTRDAPRLADVRVLIRSPRLPGGSGWQGLPPWLPQDRTVWSAEARFIVQPLPEVGPPR